MSNDGSGEVRMSEGVQERVMAAVTGFGGQQALRCLALAYKTHSGSSSKVCSPLSYVQSRCLYCKDGKSLPELASMTVNMLFACTTRTSVHYAGLCSTYACSTVYIQLLS